jgi:hypothetical protein
MKTTSVWPSRFSLLLSSYSNWEEDGYTEKNSSVHFPSSPEESQDCTFRAAMPTSSSESPNT